MRRLLTALLFLVATALGAETKPNILVLLTDDIGWGDAKCYNPNGKIPTPNLDKLAASGMRFTHAHTPIEEKDLLAAEPDRAATLAAEFKRIRNRKK